MIASVLSKSNTAHHAGAYTILVEDKYGDEYFLDNEEPAYEVLDPVLKKISLKHTRDRQIMIGEIIHYWIKIYVFI